MHDYLLTIRIPFKALDDAQARSTADEIMDLQNVPTHTILKLQRMTENKAPQKVNWDIKDTGDEANG